MRGWRARLQALLALARRTGAVVESADNDALYVKHAVDNRDLICADHGRSIIDVGADRMEAWGAEIVTPAEWAALMTLYAPARATPRSPHPAHG